MATASGAVTGMLPHAKVPTLTRNTPSSPISRSNGGFISLRIKRHCIPASTMSPPLEGPEESTPSASASDAAAAAAAVPKPRKLRPGEKKGFVEEMRFVAMKLHSKDQAKEGEKEADVQPVGAWKPTVEGYLKFLVDSKLVYDTLEHIVAKSSHPSYAEFRNTGLERSAALERDLAWFAGQGYAIPEAGSDGKSYAEYLQDLSEKDPPAFICHFYNIYFAHTAGGRFIGKKVAETILDGKELEFYKWEGDLPTILSSVKHKLNRVAEEWSREDKDRCLKETEKSFQYSGKILRLIIS